MTGDTLSESSREFLEGLKQSWLSKPYELEALRRLVATFEPVVEAGKP